MRRLFPFSLVALAILFSLRSTHGVSNAQNSQQLPRDSRSDCYSRLLDKMMPVSNLGEFSKDSKWLVIIRILPPFGRQEARLTLQKLYSGEAQASITTPKGQSFYNQCADLKTKHPGNIVEEYLLQVAVDRVLVSSKDLQQLTEFSSRFEAIRMSPAPPDELANDSTRYEIWSESQYGQHINFILSGPGPGSSSQPHPLLQWVEDYRGLLEGSRRRASSSNSSVAH